jgi:hypothetical protein
MKAFAMQEFFFSVVAVFINFGEVFSLGKLLEDVVLIESVFVILYE